MLQWFALSFFFLTLSLTQESFLLLRSQEALHKCAFLKWIILLSDSNSFLSLHPQLPYPRAPVQHWTTWARDQIPGREALRVAMVLREQPQHPPQDYKGIFSYRNFLSKQAKVLGVS